MSNQFVWNKEKTFCIRSGDIRSFGINTDLAGVYIAAFVYDKDMTHYNMGRYKTSEEARVALEGVIWQLS